MPKLSAKLESFIETMRRDEEFTRHGFELLSKRADPENYFDAIRDAGFLDPANNSGLVPSTEPGFVQVPFWSALNYLEAVARRAGELNDMDMANKVRAVVATVTLYRDADGQQRDNYHTYFKFAEFFGLLPLQAITRDDIALVSVWLTSRYDHGLVGSSLGKGLLKRLLACGTPADIEKACLLMKQLTAFRWLPGDDKRGRDLVSAVDDHWLREIIDTYAKELGAKAGAAAVSIFEDGLRAIFSDTRRSYGSTLWRPAIEDSPQNMDFRAVENRLVEGMRDALDGWIEADPAAGAAFVRNALKDSAEIIRRIAIHATTEHFEPLKEALEGAIAPGLFSSGHRHELFRFLRERFSALSEAGKNAVVASLRALPMPTTGDDPERRLQHTQREWLMAIAGQPQASSWYAELSADPALGPPSDHPDFLSYHEMRHGPGPSPFEAESLIVFAEDGTLIDRLNGFTEINSWKGPTLGGLVAALEGAVAKYPNTFLPLLSAFHGAKLPFQHALLSGFKRLFEPANEAKPEFDWGAAWPKLIRYFTTCIADPAFWTHTPEEEVNLIPTRAWMVSLIGGFLEAGTRDDKTAYAPELLPQGWVIIRTLLDRAPDEKPSQTDPMTHALNTEKGQLIGAMYNHALRVCRLAKTNKRPVASAWATLQDAFDAELAKCHNSNFDFSTLSASYIGNIEFMSHDWLAANVKRLFPAEEYPANFKVALAGLAYARPTRPIYELLRANGVFEEALKTSLKDQHSRERVIEWVSLGYLWGDETLDSPLFRAIFTGGADDLQIVVDLFWRVHGDKLTDRQVEKVVAFWKESVAWAQAQAKTPVSLLARLGRLSAYLTALTPDAKALLLAIVPHVHTEYSTDQIVEELARLVATDPAATAEILERMLDAHAPNYDMDDKLKGLIQALADAGHRAAALRCIDKLRQSLPGMLDFYRKLFASA